jgi:hypothetical protein
MEDLKNRILEIAKNYNPNNAEWLTKMTLGSKRIRRLIKFNLEVSDDDIHNEVNYYEEDYDGDCFETACFGTIN